MNHKRTLALFVTIGILLLAAGPATGQEAEPHSPQGTVDTTASAPLSTSFTYQGQLIQNGAPVNGDCDFLFSLWDASAGNPIGATQGKTNVSVSGGLFTVQLDFGAEAFRGDARWLEVAVRCPAGSGDYATLSPRQELTAAPAALALKLPYTAQANISGPLVTFHNTGDGEAALFQSNLGYALWVESALLDGLHIAAAGGDGVAVTSAGSDGLYVGQAGVNGVNIGNVVNSGLRVNWAGYHAVHVGTSLIDGVHVDSAGQDGLSVQSAGADGLAVVAAVDDGVTVGSAGDDGVYVGSAGDDGMYVHQAGSPSEVLFDDSHNGFEVAGAQGYGLYVGRSDVSGVHVNSAGFNGVAVNYADQTGVVVNLAGSHGVYVNSAGHDGVNVGTASDDGMYVHQAGSPSATTPSDAHNGFEVAGAQGNGLYVGLADVSGVHVNSAGGIGVYVVSAGVGVYVGSADGDGFSVPGAGAAGLYVGTVGDDGVQVHRAGSPSWVQWSDQKNGFEVAGAQGHGLYVGRADNTGVYVHSAGWNGVIVEAAGGDGVRATATTYNALYGDTTNAQGEWGLYTPDKVYSQNVTLQTLTLIAQVSGPTALSPGDVVAAAGVGASLPGTGAPLPLVRLAGSEAIGVVGVVEGRLALTPVPQPEGEEAGERLELRSAEGPARPGDYVALTVLGLAQVRVDVGQGTIQPGARLTGGVGGRARALKTVAVEDVTLAESAPTIGVALAAPDADGLVWVLVNPE